MSPKTQSIGLGGPVKAGIYHTEDLIRLHRLYTSLHLSEFENMSQEVFDSDILSIC